MKGTVPKDYWILTREQFIEALDVELEDERKTRIAKFDKGAKKYGGDVDLFYRDFKEEKSDELTDYRNYDLFDRVKSKRKEALLK